VPEAVAGTVYIGTEHPLLLSHSWERWRERSEASERASGGLETCPLRPLALLGSTSPMNGRGEEASMFSAAYPPNRPANAAMSTTNNTSPPRLDSTTQSRKGALAATSAEMSPTTASLSR